MKKYQLLIGSCGGLTGIYLAKQFRRFPNVNIIGADANPNSAGRFFVDDFVYLPSASNSDFIDALVDLLNSHQIDFYMPTHSKETFTVSKNELQIRGLAKSDFVISPIETYQSFNNKVDAYTNLANIGIPVPQIYFSDSEIKYPAYHKRKVGSGSSGCGKVCNAQEYVTYKNDSELFICEYLDGMEYTVDCMFSRNGTLLGYNQRKRIKNMGGAVIITANDNEFDILPYIIKISENFVFKGCVNFQYILRDKPYFTDINLRFASGGMPLSVKSGVDIPKAYYKLFTNQEIGTNEFASDKKNRTMYRYFEEKYSE